MGRLVDAHRLVLERRPSLLVAEALDVHRSHVAQRIHARFAQFDRRGEGWHTLRELVLSTFALSPDEERVFDVLFFFGPMPRQRAMAWARVPMLPAWAAPWRERAAEGYVEIDPRALPTMRAQLPAFRPTPDAMRAALEALRAELLRRERSRALGSMLSMAAEEWLRGVQSTLAGEPDLRATATALSIHSAEDIRRLVGPAHIDVARWLRAAAARERAWTYWVPMGCMAVHDARARVLTKAMDEDTRRRLYGLPPLPPPPAPLPEPPPRKVTSRRAARASLAPSETPSPSTLRSRRDPAAAPTPSARETAPSRRCSRRRTGT